jgi:hypothetical protein
MEGCQKAIDAEWHDSIMHTPGSMPGAELPFKTTLEKELKIRVSIHITTTTTTSQTY